MDVYARLGSEGLKPWLDKKSLRPGDDWKKCITAAIRASEFFLVLLTKKSVNKEGYLQKEIKEALDIQDEQPDSGRYVIPVRLEECEIPERLAHIQSADLFEKDGWPQLLEILSERPAAPPAQRKGAEQTIARAQRLPEGGLATPCFFPSISSAAKNALSPQDHLEILVRTRHPLFLISAFDIATAATRKRKALMTLLKTAAKQGQVVLMDSGLYEKKWLRAKEWPVSSFYVALKEFPFHLAFAYDNPSPSGSIGKIASEIESAVRKARRISKFNALIPIVHARTPAQIVGTCVQVAKRLDALFVAVPERELGESVRGCAVRLAELRQALNARLNRYVAIHVLGTGNPLSILTYVHAGADSFDGLDWCQTVADHESGRLHHSLQLDFFAEQSGYSAATQMSYMSRALGHNLEFYTRWMQLIQEHLAKGTLESLLEKYLPRLFVQNLKSDLRGIESLSS